MLFSFRDPYVYARVFMPNQQVLSISNQLNRTEMVLAPEMPQKYDNHRGKSSNVRGSVLATDERITTGGLIFLRLPPAAH
jgi:hypothetical protein